MALKTPEEFVQSLADLDLQIYLFGEKVDDYVNHPLIRPSINCIAMTYELAAQPEYEDLMLATSHLTGKKVNRFTHIHQSTEDLSKKVKMQRLLGQKTGSCFQRCVGMDAINALSPAPGPPMSSRERIRGTVRRSPLSRAGPSISRSI